MFTLKRLGLLMACLAFLATACGGAQKPKGDFDDDEMSEEDDESSSSKRKKRAADDEDEDEEDLGEDDIDVADEEEEDEAPRKKRGKRVSSSDGEDEEEADEGGGVEEVRLSRKERERQERRDRDRERLRKQLEKEEGRKSSPFRRKKADKKRAPVEDDEDEVEADDEEFEDKPDPKKAAAAKKQADAERRAEEAARKKAEAQAKKEEAARKKAEAAERKREEAARKKADAQAKKDAAAKKRAEELARKKEEAAAKKRKQQPADEEEDFEDEDEEVEEKVASKPAARPAPEPEAEAEEEEEEEEDDTPIDFDKLEEEDDPLAQKRVAAVAVRGVDGEPTDDGELDPASAAFVPLSTRSLTIGKGRAEFHGGLRAAKVTFPGTDGNADLVSSSQAFILGGTYGVNDKLEIGGDYTLSVNPGTVKGPLLLRAAYQLKTGKLDFAIAGGLAVDFFEQTNTVTMMTTSITFASLQLGAWARYHVSPKLTLFTGQPALPSSSVGLSKLSLPLPPFQYQLAVGINESGPIALELPVGAGYQATRAIYLMTSLNLAHIRLANTQTGILFRDFIPFVAAGFYSLKKFDVGLVFSDDLKQGMDYLRFDAVIRYQLK